MSEPGSMADLEFMQQESLREIAHCMNNVEETIDDITKLNRSNVNSTFGEMSEYSWMHFDAHTEDLRQELKKADKLEDVLEMTVPSSVESIGEIHLKASASPASSSLSASLDNTLSTASTPRSERLLRAFPRRLLMGKSGDPAHGGPLLSLAKRMDDMENTIDEMSESNPSLRSVRRNLVRDDPLSHVCSTVEEDTHELKRELNLAKDVEPLDIEDSEAQDKVPAIEACCSSVSSNCWLKRARSTRDLTFIKRGSLIKLAMKMRDLDDTLDEFSRKLDESKSDLHVSRADSLDSYDGQNTDELDALQRELDGAEGVEALSDIDKSVSTSSVAREQKSEDTMDANKSVHSADRDLVSPSTAPTAADNTSTCSSGEESQQFADPQNDGGTTQNLNQSLISNFSEHVDTSTSVASTPSRLDLLKAKTRRLRSCGAKKIEESRRFIQECQDSRRVVGDDSWITGGGSIESRPSTYFQTDDAQIPEHVEFNAVGVNRGLAEESRLREENESLKQLLECIKEDRTKLRDELEVTRKDNARTRRLLWVTVALWLCTLLFCSGQMLPIRAVVDKVPPDIGGFPNPTSFMAHAPARIVLTVQEPVDIEEGISRETSVSLASSHVDLNSSPLQEKDVNMGLITRIPIRSRLIRGALRPFKHLRGLRPLRPLRGIRPWKRIRPPVRRLMISMKRIGRKLMGDSEAGGVLDFKHNNVGVWAHST